MGCGPLVSGFSIGGFIGCWRRATDDDDSVADLGLFHGGPCPGDGQQDLRISVRMAMSPVKGPLASPAGQEAENSPWRRAAGTGRPRELWGILIAAQGEG